MKIQSISIKDIKPCERNAKRHPKEQIARIAKSIKEFGWQQPVVLDSSNTIVIGHGRYFAAKKLRMKEIPCVCATELTEQQASALRLADNKVAESEWDLQALSAELAGIVDFDMSAFGFDIETLVPSVPDTFLEESQGGAPANAENDDVEDDAEEDGTVEGLPPSCRHNVFENQERMQFETDNYYGFPEMMPTQTVGDKLLRFCDKATVKDNDFSEYICHFFVDDYMFMQVWRDPDKYVGVLSRFKAVISPDFSLYTDFPRALQILSCYRRQWCGAYWQKLGIDVIPNVRWGEPDSFEFCFDGIPRHSVVAVSSVGVRNDDDWNGKADDCFVQGWNEMLRRLEPTKIIHYGSMLDGLGGDIVQIPTSYELRARKIRERLKEKKQNGN